MNDFKTEINPLIPIGRLVFIISMGGMVSFYIYPVFRNFKTSALDWLALILVFAFFGLIFNLFIIPFIEKTKNYLIKDNSIEEFNFLTSKTKSIDKDDIEGFSTSEIPYGIWRGYKEIIIYLKNGTIIPISQYSYFNFKNIEPTLVAKNYNYLGHEEYERIFFDGRIYKYDDSNSDKKPNDTGQGVKAKIIPILIPYLIISLITVFGWTFLHWLLFIKLNIYSVNEGVLVIIIPLVLSVNSIFIWLYKKIKLLNIQSGKLALYSLVPCATMFGLSLFVQQYIIVKTAKVTNLSSIIQIDKGEPTKFYILKNFYLDKNHISIKKQFFNQGRTSNLVMNIYITVPILNSAKDTLSSNCMAWYGVHCTNTEGGFMSKHNVKESWQSGRIVFSDVGIDTIENSKEVKKFTHECMTKLDRSDTNHFLYWDRISKTDYDYDGYVSAIKNNTKYDTKSKITLLPHNESLAESASDKLIYALAVFGIGSLLFLIMVIKADLKSEEDVSK